MNCVGVAMFAIDSGFMKPVVVRPVKLVPKEALDEAEEDETISEDAIDAIVTITTRCRLVVMPRTIGAMKSVIVFIVPVTSETSILSWFATFSAFWSWIESEMSVRAATFTPSCTESTSIFTQPFLMADGIFATEPAYSPKKA